MTSLPRAVATGAATPAGDGARPLEAEDLAILALENDTIVGHTCKVIVVGQPGLDRRALLARLAGRLHRAPQLTCRLDQPDRPRSWVPDPEFVLDRHVLDLGGGPVDRDGLLAAVAQLFEQHLDRSRPLWSMTLVALEGGRSAVVWRLHHALADGTTAARLATLLLWDEVGPDAPPHPRQLARAHREDDHRRRAHLAGFLRREFGRQHGGSPFDGQIGTSRQMGLATTSLADLHAAARSLDGATVNDAVLAVVGGALRRWLEERHGPLVNVRARVPVSLHHEGDHAGNRDSYFCLELPLGEQDPVARLRSVHRQTALRKSADDAQHLDAFYRELSTVSPRLRRFATRLQDSPRRFALSVSNVPGPEHPVDVLSAPLDGLFSFAEIGEHHALRVAAVSHADQLSLGFCADPVLVPAVQAMAGAAEAEAAVLAAAAGVGSRPEVSSGPA